MAHQDVLTYLSLMDPPIPLNKVIVVWDRRILNKGEGVDMPNETLTMPFRGFLVFVDLIPRANWAHPCLYVLLPENYTDYLTPDASLPQQAIQASFPPSWYFRQELPDSAFVILKYGKEPEDGKNVNPY